MSKTTEKTSPQKPQNTMDFATVKRLLSYLFRGYRFQFGVVILLIFISALASAQLMLFIQVLIDDFITPMLGVSNPDFTALRQAITRTGIFAAVGVFASWAYNRIMLQIAQGILRQIRKDMFTHMQTLPIGYFDTHSAGDVMSYYTNDTDTLRQMISQSIPQMISSVITIVTMAVAMLLTNLPLSLFVGVSLVLMLQVIKRIAGHSGKYFVQQQISLGNLNGFVEEMIEGQKVVKVFTHEEEVKADFKKFNDILAANNASANSYANILMPTMGNLGNLQYILLAMVGGGLAIAGVGGLTLGTIASFLQMSKSITQPFGQISQQLNMVAMALAGADRIFKFLDESPEEDEGTVTLVNAHYNREGELEEWSDRTQIWAWKLSDEEGQVTYRRLEGQIYFYNVNFAYVPNKPVLHDINMYAEPGQKLAFVGATGAGKTTITNLINRFYDITEGRIEYDGIDIKDIKKSDLRRSLGIVLQDTHLFTGTITQNILYGRPDADVEEVEAAATLANAHSFISRLPNGYDTLLEDSGASLSQGQRQLLSIARAAIADPPVMILDEATSSIDTRTEMLVQGGMDSLMYNRTVFVIAHRLSTIKNSDVIMVMDLGRIVERGNHDKLIEEKGIYYQLYTGAFELDNYE